MKYDNNTVHEKVKIMKAAELCVEADLRVEVFLV